MSVTVAKPFFYRTLQATIIGLVCAALCSCGSGTSAVIQEAIRGDGPGTFKPLNTIEAHQVKDLPRSRSGNSSAYEVFGKTYQVLDSAQGYKKRGVASWYGKKFHGNPTASGETYDMHLFTAAHKTLPLPVYVRVTNLDNGRKLVVKVNDRGPFAHDREIDLSFAAARELGVYKSGTANVEIEALSDAYVDDGLQMAAADTQAPVGGAWVIQLGAFKDMANASSMQGTLGADLAGRTLINHDPSAQLYRVLLGPLSSSDEADKLLVSLASAGIDGYTLKAQVQ